MLAHTFMDGVPLELLGANNFIEEDYGHFKRIASTKGEDYLDIAWPIFFGKAGVLRLGFSVFDIFDMYHSWWFQSTSIIS